MGFKLTRLKTYERNVRNNLDPKKRQFLTKFGAFTRQDARQSIRSGGPVAAPGRPPKSRTGALKRFILFFVDTENESVVIGPQILPGKDRIGGVTQPAAHEYGTHGTRRYAMRPFMRPAFDRTLAKLEGLLRQF